ncbi:ATP-binding protein [Hoeflea sp.]|uniref:ATP-binding protein n=1 Tax=Hoeflea sp. TaxID=1940281 RepID=UPI003A957272
MTSKAILLIANEGDIRELKSLETFRDILIGGLPGGLGSDEQAILQASSIADRAAEILKRRFDICSMEMTKALQTVFSFLSSAYREAGNDEKRWTEAFWLHLDMLSDALETALKSFPSDLPNRETMVVFASAGLPQPKSKDGFSTNHKPSDYVKVVRDGWSEIDDIELSLLGVQERDGNGEDHLLAKLDWSGFVATRTSLGHGLLALAFHGHQHGTKRIDAWAATSEAAFFDQSKNGEVAYQLWSLDGGKEKEIPKLLWRGVDHVLPPAAPRRRDDGIVLLGQYKLRLELDPGENPGAKIDCKPASACSAIVVACTAIDGAMEVEFELYRKLAKKGGKWREKPFTLSLSPTRTTLASQFRETFELKLCAPNPVIPSTMAIQRNIKGKAQAPSFTAESFVAVDSDGQLVEPADTPDCDLTLSDNGGRAELVIIGDAKDPAWIGGAKLKPTEGTRSDYIHYYELTGQPADPAVDVGGKTVSITVPLVDNGQVNPFLAAFIGEPVIAASEDLSEEMELDPRGDLEKWLRDSAILAAPDEHFRASLGTCLVEVGLRAAETKLRWDDGLCAFTNTDGAKSVTFPSDISTSEAGDRFWKAFLALGLGNEPVIGQQSVRALPSTLDLRSIARDKVEAYLEAYGAILEQAKGVRARSWAAYPFSALLYDSLEGVAKGVLLSPLHPVRLAWAWSVQAAGVDINDDPVFSKVSRSFLRFVDGEMFPEAGPSTDTGKTWVSTGLAPGPHEMFVGWSMLSGLPFEAANQAQSLKLLGLDLPFGTPSGLDQGGVSSALRDYLRLFPASQHLRIGLAAPRGGKRFEETDDAIIAASFNLLSEREGQLPGGIRIVDSSERKGAPPSSSRVLERLQDVGDSRDGVSLPPFEWMTEDASSPEQHHVDLQFVEDSVVTVHMGVALGTEQAICTAGPGLPVNRFRSWQLERAKDSLSSFGLGIDGSSFADLAGFTSALIKLEALQVDGDACRLEARMQLGHRMLGENAKWTITGNRNLSPAVLSAQLRESRADVALWEWRPAFLSRQRQKSAISAISSTHPYTVLAKPSGTLTTEIKRVLGKCGVHNEDDDVAEVITSLGMRGVGLSSLLTMGHTQSLGAIGFNLAFRGLTKWEGSASPGEIRSVVPMDSVYPLLDLLGEGARTPDDQRRADLLLLSAKIDDAGICTVRMHPIEVKMRTGHTNRFPTREKLEEPLEQLDSTFKVLDQVTKNLIASGSRVLPWTAFTSFLEAAFSLRPASASSNPALEARILSSVASSTSRVVAERGTVLWFQVGGRTEDGEEFDRFFAEGSGPGGVLIDPAAFNIPSVSGHVQGAIADVIDDGLESLDGRPMQPTSEPETEADAPCASTSVETPRYDDLPSGPNPVHDETSGNSQDVPEVKSGLGVVHSETAPVGELAEPSLPELMAEVPSVAMEIDPGAGIEVLVGHYPQGSTQRPIHLKLSETALSQMNIGVVGDLGTGKTQFLKSLVYQVANSASVNRGTAPKVFIFDYKRDYSEKEYPVALGAQVLDPAKAPLPINFFAIDTNRLVGSIQMERVRRANFFSDLLRRISNIGVVQRNDLYGCVIAAYAAAPQGSYPTINDVYEAYQGLGKNDSVISVLRMLVDLMIFESDPSQTRSFVEMFDRNTVLNLSGISGAGQDIVDIVATMFLDNLYTDYMKTREKKPFITGEDGKSRRYVDSFVLIDEAHHAMGRDFDVLMKLMLEGREFGIGVILSSQYLSHFNTRVYNWAEALSTWVVHNVRNATAKQFEAIGFRSNVADMVSEVTKLPTHWAYYRCMNNHNEGILMKGQPFFSLEL